VNRFASNGWTSATVINLYFGPAVSIEYNFGRREMNENQQRHNSF
jgi:hypothetical protein